MKLRNLLIAAAGLAVAGGAATSASAYDVRYCRDHACSGAWADHHGYRVQVNHRLSNLNRSIVQERREGEISAARARYLHARVHTIRMQERYIASRRGSHIGRSGQAMLNREESGVRRHIPG